MMLNLFDGQMYFPNRIDCILKLVFSLFLQLLVRTTSRGLLNLCFLEVQSKQTLISKDVKLLPGLPIVNLLYILVPQPEVRVETLPSLLQSQRALLILFSEGPLHHGHEKHILSLVRGKYLESYLACWLNL